MNNQFNKYNQNDIEKTNQPLLTLLREGVNYCLLSHILTNKKTRNSFEINKNFNNKKQIAKQQIILYGLLACKFDELINKLTQKKQKCQQKMNVNRQIINSAGSIN